MPYFQVTQVFICSSELTDIPHVDTVLVEHAAQRVTGRDNILVAPGLVLDFIVQFILGNRFIFLSSLVDRLTGFRQ